MKTGMMVKSQVLGVPAVGGHVSEALEFADPAEETGKPHWLNWFITAFRKSRAHGCLEFCSLHLNPEWCLLAE